MQTRSLTRAVTFPLLLWGALRILTSVLATFVSSIRPLNALEEGIPLWPASAPVSVWLERVLLSPWLRWDVDWFVRIVTNGYHADDGTANFQPLFPWLATPLERIGIHPVLSLLLVGAIAGIALLIFYQRLAALDLAPEQARFSSVLLLLFPSAFIIFAPYSESLFLLFAVLCLLLARQQRWGLAGLAGGLAALTRQQGILLIVPLAWEIWQSRKDKNKPHRNEWRKFLPLLLVPAGMVVWMLFRWLALGDVLVDPSNFQSLVYSILISPSANQVVPIQSFVWPWQGLWYALVKITTQPDPDIWVNLLTAGLFTFFLIIAWKHMRPSYRIYALLITLISFSYHTGPFHPYMGLPRHLLLAFPVFVGLASALKRPWMRLALVGICACGNLFTLTLYVLKVWVP